MPPQKADPQTRIYMVAARSDAEKMNEILVEHFEDDGIPISLFEVEPDSKDWSISMYVAQSTADDWCNRIVKTLKQHGVDATPQREELGNIDWVSQTLEKLSPVKAGRFVVHGGHDRYIVAPNQIGIEIEAGQAFGTGHHGTTAGCLDMFDKCLKRQAYYNALDLGTGSGVLAIAAAKALRIPVLATDIDPVATKVTKENSRFNRTHSYVTAETANGFEHCIFESHGPFDLVIANILAGPLIKLAKPMAQHLLPGATVILSGLLPHHRARIVSAYAHQGIIQQAYHHRDGWLTLVLRAA